MGEQTEFDIAESRAAAITRFDSVGGLLVAVGLAGADYRLLTSPLPETFVAGFVAGTLVLWMFTAFILWRALILQRPRRAILTSEGITLKYGGGRRAAFSWQAWDSNLSFYHTGIGSPRANRGKSFMIVESPVRHNITVPESLVAAARRLATQSGLREVIKPEYPSSLTTRSPTAESIRFQRA